MSPAFFSLMETKEEFWQLLVLMLARRVYELEQRIKKLEKNKNIIDTLEEAKDSPWGKHYQVAWAMFLDKPIIGHGYNSFQIKCKKYEEITNTNTGKFRGCSTHPHNAFLEILAEQGLIGFLILGQDYH